MDITWDGLQIPPEHRGGKKKTKKIRLNRTRDGSNMIYFAFSFQMEAEFCKF